MHDHFLYLTQFIELARESKERKSSQLSIECWFIIDDVSVLQCISNWLDQSDPDQSKSNTYIRKLKDIYLRWSGCAKWEERKGHKEKAGLVNRFFNINLLILLSCVRSLWINFPKYEVKDEVFMNSFFCNPLFGS